MALPPSQIASGSPEMGLWNRIVLVPNSTCGFPLVQHASLASSMVFSVWNHCLVASDGYGNNVISCMSIATLPW